MSRSQFHLWGFILRHAWLNLWDKHMTTGRINQVWRRTLHLNAHGEPQTFSAEALLFKCFYTLAIQWPRCALPSSSESSVNTDTFSACHVHAEVHVSGKQQMNRQFSPTVSSWLFHQILFHISPSRLIYSRSRLHVLCIWKLKPAQIAQIMKPLYICNREIFSNPPAARNISLRAQCKPILFLLVFFTHLKKSQALSP